MVAPERVLIAIVAENREPFTREAMYLFKTLRRFGGQLARAQGIAYFVGSIEPATARRFNELDVTFKIVDPVDGRCPHANKIRMLDETVDYDYLVALDTDIVITRDFSPYIQGSSVAAKPAGQGRLSMDQWTKLFAYFGLELPVTRYLTTAKLRETIPYFNSGVVLLPKHHVPPLRDAWHASVRKLLDAYDVLPDIAERKAFTDQFALSLALASAQLPYRGLPLEMNFPTDRPVHAALNPEGLTPYILHHHHRISASGDILPCSYENVNTLIGELNAYLRLTDTT